MRKEDGGGGGGGAGSLPAPSNETEEEGLGTGDNGRDDRNDCAAEARSSRDWIWEGGGAGFLLLWAVFSCREICRKSFRGERGRGGEEKREREREVEGEVDGKKKRARLSFFLLDVANEKEETDSRLRVKHAFPSLKLSTAKLFSIPFQLSGFLFYLL